MGAVAPATEPSSGWFGRTKGGAQPETTAPSSTRVQRTIAASKGGTPAASCVSDQTVQRTVGSNTGRRTNRTQRQRHRKTVWRARCGLHARSPPEQLATTRQSAAVAPKLAPSTRPSYLTGLGLKRAAAHAADCLTALTNRFRRHRPPITPRTATQAAPEAPKRPCVIWPSNRGRIIGQTPGLRAGRVLFSTRLPSTQQCREGPFQVQTNVVVGRP